MRLTIKAGFTLVEMVLVMGLVALLFTLASTISISSIAATQVDTSTSLVITDLRTTQSSAMSGKSSSGSPVAGWGIYFESTRYTIFPGTTYVQGAPGNIVVELPANTTLNSSVSSIVFKSLTGELLAPDPVPSFAISSLSQTKTFTLNSLGVPQFP